MGKVYSGIFKEESVKRGGCYWVDEGGGQGSKISRELLEISFQIHFKICR